jgi:7,8-dihydropterin-6-yl-methyl-4-(beta-D-ribofuranosyl)aminobenzene 5'-phosphate synthase
MKRTKIKFRLIGNVSSKLKDSEKISIITIYDNYSVDPRLKIDHGFSALIKFENKNILFDTGANPKILLGNMDKIVVDPQGIDFIFISHLHHDHTGGLEEILKAKPNLKVYKPESFFGSVEIIKGVWTTGPMGDTIKEQSLIINSKRGLIIITGCAHPGVINIISKAKEVFPSQPVHLVLGGFHLSGISETELHDIIRAFRELGVEKVAPCHCSGNRIRELLSEEYQNDYIENGVGAVINIE